jgi:hypothetical protein
MSACIPELQLFEIPVFFVVYLVPDHMWSAQKVRGLGSQNLYFTYYRVHNFYLLQNTPLWMQCTCSTSISIV